MSLYFARHGQTKYNLEDRFQGLSDSPLTDLGRDQAKRLGEFAKRVGVQQLIVSPRGRALATAQIVAEVAGLNLPPIVDETWQEMCYGAWEERATTEITDEPEYSTWREYRFDFTYPGSYHDQPGDGYAARYAELLPTLEFLAGHFPTSPTLVIAHYTPLRFVRKYFDHLSDEAAMAYEPTHDRVLALSAVAGQIKLTEEVLA